MSKIGKQCDVAFQLSESKRVCKELEDLNEHTT